jgi:hypothetical protein
VPHRADPIRKKGALLSNQQGAKRRTSPEWSPEEQQGPCGTIRSCHHGDLACLRPTHVKELISANDHYYGYCKACTTGAGGVWFSGECTIEPIVWRVGFEAAIASQVVSDNNPPQGRLTNSDLKMAAVLLHNMVLHQEVDMQFAQAGALLDNMPTVSWTTKMADKSQSPTAGRLLQGLAPIQRASQAGPLMVASIAGIENSMADVASPSFGQNRVPDALFLSQFTHTFPLPQPQS